MLINNFEKLENFVKGHVLMKEHDFLFGQIIRRRKDNPEIGRDNIVIKDYFFDSIDSVRLSEKEIISICEAVNARFYVNLNIRNKKKVALKCMIDLATHISNESYNIRSLYSSACGKSNSEKHKKWVVDLDDVTESEVEYYISYINHKMEPLNDNNKVLETFKTVNGFHLISKPFRLDKFSEVFSHIDVQKDNPTLIYFKQ